MKNKTTMQKEQCIAPLLFVCLLFSCATNWQRFTYYTHGFSQLSYFLIRNPLVSYSFSSQVFVEVVFPVLSFFGFFFFLFSVRCWYFIHTSCDDIPSPLYSFLMYCSRYTFGFFFLFDFMVGLPRTHSLIHSFGLLLTALSVMSTSVKGQCVCL